MRRETFIHFAFWFSFFVIVSIFRNYLSLNYWQFWVGGIIGTILPNIDHLIYVLFLNPQELTSQRVSFLLKRKEILRILTLLSETRSERKNLIFHTLVFQIIFTIVTFLIFSSSTSILARGIVLSFSIHLLVDQLVDLLELKDLKNWGKLSSEDLNYRNSIIYIFVMFLLVCIIGFLM